MVEKVRRFEVTEFVKLSKQVDTNSINVPTDLFAIFICVLFHKLSIIEN
jgi:hypothetical protein